MNLNPFHKQPTLGPITAAGIIVGAITMALLPTVVEAGKSLFGSVVSLVTPKTAKS